MPKSKNADPTVIAQQVVAGMGIPERQSELECRAVEEAVDDLGVPVADLVGFAADIVEADALAPNR